MRMYVYTNLRTEERRTWDRRQASTHISELHQAQLSQLTDAVVGRAGLEEELHQAHLLAAEHGAHFSLRKGGRGGGGEHDARTNHASVSQSFSHSFPVFYVSTLKPQGNQ